MASRFIKDLIPDEATKNPLMERLQLELFQFYYCLYHVKLDKDLERHYDHYLTNSITMEGKKELSEMFEVLLCYVKDFVSVSPNVRASIITCLSKIFTEFGDFPSGYAANKEIIHKYLAGEIEDLSTVTMSEIEDVPYNFVYQNLYYLLANVMTRKTDKEHRFHTGIPTEDDGKKEQKIIWLHKNDLSVNPTRIESWFLLGKSYYKILNRHLDSLLPWTHFSEKTRGEINNYRTKSKSCLKRLVQLKEDDSWGWHLLAHMHYIQSRYYPFGRVPTIPILSDHSTLLQDELYQKKKELLTNSYDCFDKALKYSEESSPDFWKMQYWCAKIKLKLNYPLEESLELYESAMLFVKKYSGTQKKLSQYKAELFYALHAARLKCLCRNPVLTDHQVKVLFKYGHEVNSEYKYTELSPEETRNVLFNDCMTAMKHCNTIYEYFHKSVYLAAFVNRYFLLEQPQIACDGLSKLFSLKKLSRNFVQVWRLPAFDGPGKFEIYRYRYISFYIQLLTETKNEKTLFELQFKILRDPITKYHYSLLQEGYKSHHSTASSLVEELYKEAQMFAKTPANEENKNKNVIDLTTASSFNLQKSQERVMELINRGHIMYNEVKQATTNANPIWGEIEEITEKEKEKEDQEPSTWTGLKDKWTNTLTKAYHTYLIFSQPNNHELLNSPPSFHQVLVFCNTTFRKTRKRKKKQPKVRALNQSLDSNIVPHLTPNDLAQTPKTKKHLTLLFETHSD